MGLEGEERRVPVAREPSRGSAQRLACRAQPPQPRPSRDVQPARAAEEVAAPRRGEKLSDPSIERRGCLLEQLAGERRLGARQLPRCRPLLWSSEAEQGGARAGQAVQLGAPQAQGRPPAERSGDREGVEQRIAGAHVPVEVRQRCQAREVGLLLVRYQCQPQPQLGEPHRRELEIDPVQGTGEHVPPHRRGRRLASPRAQRRQLLERAQQERARADRRVEHHEAPHVRSGCGRLAVVDPVLRRSRGQPQPAHQRRLEPRPHQLAHQRRWRVVAAAALPLLRVHHALEHPAEHVGRHQILPVALAHREVKPLEQLVERVAPLRVAPLGRPVPPFQGSGLEQPTVQERQAPERACGARAVAQPAVQRAEAQWIEHAPLKPAPEAMDEVLPVAVEPSLGLHEVEEQHPRERGEGERVPLEPAGRSRQTVCKPLQGGAKRLEEARGDALTRERLARPQAQPQRRLSGAGGAALERRERAPRNGVEREHTCSHAQPRAATDAPGGARETPGAAPEGAYRPLGVRKTAHPVLPQP